MTTRPPEGTEVQKALGELFRAKRTQKGISLKAMAQMMRCSINTIRWHEAGGRSLRADELVQAASLMGCSPTILMLKRNQNRTPKRAASVKGSGDEADAAAA